MTMPSRFGLAACSEIALLLLLAGCHESDSPAAVASRPPEFVGQVTIAPNANAWAPLAMVLSLETNVPTRVELRISDPDRSWNVVAEKDFATNHPSVPVIGMRPGLLHRVEVLVRDENGNAAVWPQPLEFTTPPLPPYFPPITVQTSEPQQMEPGVTLLPIMSIEPGSFPVMIDAEGQVVWYLDCSQIIGDAQTSAFPMRNGHLMLISDRRVLTEVDMLGNVIQVYSASRYHGAIPGTIALDTDSFHHDFVEMPEGSDSDYAVIGTELRTLPNYPASEVDPMQTAPTADVIGDEILEFRRNGEIVRRHRLLDILDPYRISYDGLGTFWDDYYARSTEDWSHANAIVLDPRTDSWIVSMRHQEAVIQIQRTTGQIEWILGDPGRWMEPWRSYLLTPVGLDFQYSYHQHAPELQPDGTIFLFDNGNGRAVPPNPRMSRQQSYSRAVQYRPDPAARTVQQLWSYGGPPGTSMPSFFSGAVGSAYVQPATGNVLVCSGAQFAPGTGPYARVFELVREAEPRTVFECTIRGTTSFQVSYFCYRAYRLAGVYR
ncbi:MAG: hypothetical protein Fur0037_09600 [Planctomycetota bacterium]